MSLTQLLTRVLHLPLLYGVLWGLLALVTLALVVAMRTPWGRERPTARYVLGSLAAHLVVICLLTTVRFVGAPAAGTAAPVRVNVVVRTPTQTPEVARAQAHPMVAAAPAPPPAAPLEAPDLLPAEDRSEGSPPTPQEAPATEAAPAAPQETSPPPPPADTQPAAPPATDAPRQEPTGGADPAPVAPTPPPDPTFAQLTASPDAATLPAETDRPSDAVPAGAGSPFAGREGVDRQEQLLESGGDGQTEDAVAAALVWLAGAQSADGRWDAARWGAGVERQAVLGQERGTTGARADTGVTGLALLALMGAGHTHVADQPDAPVVARGLDFLLRSQRPDGALYAEAEPLAQTYCHSMATFALAEALALTGDARLKPGVERGVAWLVARQHPTTGGWRYQKGDPGDMSQLGWALMALRSAELAGVSSPPTVWTGIDRFLRATQRGQHGGLSSYRPDGPATVSMTAESFYCRHIVGWPLGSGPAAHEALASITSRLPGHGQDNYYAWYYSTLGLYHHRRSDVVAQGAWQAWNAALKQRLVQTQVRSGSLAGSWSPDSVWGGYGGRVYTTAMAAMCLEVYYRYDSQSLARDPWIAARPSGAYR